MRAAALAALLTLVGALPAQVPDGSYVTASFEVGGFTGPAGVYLVDRGSGAVTPVAGLPGEITGAAFPGTTVFGADFVVRRPSDGALVTSGFGAGVTGVQIPVFVLTLTGSAVTNTQRFDVGLVTSAASRGIPQAHVLSDDRVVIAVDLVGGPGDPLMGEILGVVDPNVGPPGTPGTVYPIPVVPLPPGSPNGLAVDEAAGTIYLGMIQPGMPSEIHAVPLTGGAPSLVSTVPETITNLALANDGTVVAVCSGGGGIYFVDPLSGTATPFGSLTNLNGAAVERATGELVIATSAPNSVIQRVDAGGSATAVSPGPMGGWGTLVGVDVNHDPETYGAGTPGANSYTWAAAPNAGGLPRIGNLSFGLEVAAQPGPPLLTGIIAAGAPAPFPLTVSGLGIELDPGALLSSFSGPGAPVFGLSLPLPNNAAFLGTRLFFQSFHLESGGVLASSGGLSLTVIP